MTGLWRRFDLERGPRILYWLCARLISLSRDDVQQTFCNVIRQLCSHEGTQHGWCASQGRDSGREVIRGALLQTPGPFPSVRKDVTWLGLEKVRCRSLFTNVTLDFSLPRAPNYWVEGKCNACQPSSTVSEIQVCFETKYKQDVLRNCWMLTFV